MTNEEKMLSLLEQHSAMLDKIITDVSDLKTDMSDLKHRVTSMELTQENVILPSLQALAEGQKTLLETLAPKNRVEALEDEMAFMKQVIRAMSTEIQELKKAQ